MMKSVEFIDAVKNKILSGRQLSRFEAEKLYNIDGRNLMPFLCASSDIARKYRKDVVNLCAITNARSGLCPEDCAFCAQSERHHTGIAVYPLISEGEMLRRAEQAVREKTNRFCIVTSGRGATDKEMDVIARAVKRIKEKFPGLKMDASLGIISKAQAAKLKSAGLDRYNHNLETAQTNFSKVCTTHTYGDRLTTIKFVKDAGLEICCGGIIGLGESKRERIELAFALAKLDIDSIPLNFLNPIPKTRLARGPILSPLEILKTIALFRFILPKKEIRICGGRQANLRGLQPLIFMAGADAIIIGNYLTTKGSQPQDDIKMISDLGLKVNAIS